MDFNEARAYLQETKLKFTKTMAKEMKEALEKADIALALAVIVVEQNGISNANLEEIIRNDEEVKMQEAKENGTEPFINKACVSSNADSEGK